MAHLANQELQSKGFAVPDFPAEPSTEQAFCGRSWVLGFVVRVLDVGFCSSGVGFCS